MKNAKSSWWRNSQAKNILLLKPTDEKQICVIDQAPRTLGISDQAQIIMNLSAMGCIGAANEKQICVIDQAPCTQGTYHTEHRLK